MEFILNIFEKRKIIFESSLEDHKRNANYHSQDGGKKSDHQFGLTHRKMHHLKDKMAKTHRVAAKAIEAADKHHEKHGDDARHKKLRKRAEVLSNHADKKEASWQKKSTDLYNQDRIKRQKGRADYHASMAMAHKRVGNDEGHRLHSKAAEAHKEAGEHISGKTRRDKDRVARIAHKSAKEYSKKNRVDRHDDGWK